MRYAGERAYNPDTDGPTWGVMLFLGALSGLGCGLFLAYLGLATLVG